MHRDGETESVGPEVSPRGRLEALVPGTLVGGRYEVTRVLGSGGSSVVYSARDLTLKREVALKVLRPDRVTEVSLRRLRREVNVARDVQSPHLVPIYDIGELDFGAWISMELVEGTTLRSAITDAPLAIERVIEIAVQLLEALQTLHERGIVHRDVKPGNILVESSGNVRLADLGLARRWDSDESRVTMTEGLVGTMEYLSPEQALGHDLDGRSDLYSFGVVLFELLTGRAPFQGLSSLGTVVAHISDAAPDVRRFRPEVPAWLATVVARLLEKNRDVRYQSAGEVLQDLREQRTRWTFALRRSGTRALAGILVVVTLLAGGWAVREWSASRFDRLLEGKVTGIEALARDGRTLWRYPNTIPSAAVAKLDRSEPERVVAILAPFETATMEDWHEVSVLDRQTGRVLRTIRMPDERTVFGNFSATFASLGVWAVDLDHDGLHEIVASFAHSPYWPCYSTYYDPGEGEPRKVLYASGYNRLAATGDLDGDGIDELIYFGINNRMGWYSTLAAVTVAGKGGGNLDMAKPVASTPDAEYSGSSPDALLWYVLLPPTATTARHVIVDRERERITIEGAGDETLSIDFRGFVLPINSKLQGEARSAARNNAYIALRDGVRHLDSGDLPRASSRLADASASARASGDVILDEWIRRNELRLLIRSGDVIRAQSMLSDVLDQTTSPAEVAWDAARELHLHGHVEEAAFWYERGLSLNPRSHRGRKKYEFVEGALLALGQLGRWEDARRLVTMFATTYLEASEFYPGYFHGYIDWRTTGRVTTTIRPPEFHLGLPDLQRYWKLEFDAIGSVDRTFLERLDAEMGLVSGSTSLFRALRADVLDRLGDHAGADAEIREAWRLAAIERESDPAVLSHWDLIEERYRQMTGGN